MRDYLTEIMLPDVTRETADWIVRYIRDAVKAAGCSSVVVGLSGGLDSAVVMKLAADAIGGENVLAVFMPSKTTPADDQKSAENLAKSWGVRFKIVKIGDAVDILISAIGGEGDALRMGNIAARCRMTVLYDQAKKMGALVLGTSNLSERSMGYFTKYGDGASDVAPIANLYKTQVRQLASIIGVPKDIIDKPPSAGFWEGQTDEEEMGMTYDDLDPILCGIDCGLSDEEISYHTGTDIETVRSVRSKVISTEHKRNMPSSPEFNTSL